jgi:3-hydroxyisobutyrate dehydrogenase-like beta-hydroxyacid dehydrogenase
MTTALLGTGLLGTAIAEGMLARGEDLVVWNRTPEKALPLAAKGARVATSAAQAANDADRVHLVLSDDAAVDATLAEIAPCGVVIDHTTTLPRATKERAERCKARGIAFLSAPCFMTPTTARESKGMILASGAGWDQVKEALARMTGDVWYLGERAELAVSYKLCGNAVQVAVAGALADVIAIARGAGVDPGEVAELFTRYDVVRSLPTRAKKMARGDVTPSWNLAMARKDVRLMLETAKTGAPLAVLPGVAARMDAALADGHAADDYGAIALAVLRA